MAVLRNKFFKIFLVELVLVPVVITLFVTLSDQKKIAALIAGSLFVALGVFIISFLYSDKKRFKRITFWAALVHLFVISLPMLAMRAIHFEKDFSEIMIWGFSGPIFHSVSEKLYVVLMLASLIDLYLSCRDSTSH